MRFHRGDAAVAADPAFADEVESRSGESIAACYQCAKCTAGCPLAPDMDLPPNQVMRCVQLGMREVALGASSIWLCTTCTTCTTRCPRDVDTARVMDTLRAMALESGIKPALPQTPLFYRLLLKLVRRYGRSNELPLMAAYGLLTHHPFKDMMIGKRMFLKGKLKPFAPRVRNIKQVRGIFERASEKATTKTRRHKEG